MKVPLNGTLWEILYNSNLQWSQHFYNQSNGDQIPEPFQLRIMMSILGAFLLEIRKSMGNETTKIDNWGMLEWFMKDARKMREGTYLNS